uniref:G-protein coupled receptors family 1 profile domain-containing protein n=1 Tax=Strigamia maritima TaxID=126957 RepID=T1JG62_STRMM
MNSSTSSEIVIQMSDVAVGVLLSLVALVAVVGNVLVCVAICTERTLRRLGNLFLMSLAIADLFIACLVMSFAVANDVMGYWVFGPEFCDTWMAFDVMCCTASILHLCAVSLDRYIAIKDPLKYSRCMTRRVVVSLIASIWIVSALMSFVPIELHLHQAPNLTPLLDSMPTCALDLAPPYAVVSSCISFFGPCLVMIGLYIQLYRYAQRHVANIKAMTVPLHPDSPQTPSPSDGKAAVTLGVIMGVFLICWVPFFCVNIIDAFCKTCIPHTVFQGLTWLGYCNSALNPLIYSTFNQEFRRAFRRILIGKRTWRPHRTTLRITYKKSPMLKDSAL